jgi:hypothetical protein
MSGGRRSAAILEGLCSSREDRGTSRATKLRKTTVMKGAHREGGGCDIGGPKSGEAGDAPVTGGGWDVEGRVEAGIGKRFGGRNRVEWKGGDGDRAALIKAVEGSCRGAGGATRHRGKGGGLGLTGRRHWGTAARTRRPRVGGSVGAIQTGEA